MKRVRLLHTGATTSTHTKTAPSPTMRATGAKLANLGKTAASGKCKKLRLRWPISIAPPAMPFARQPPCLPLYSGRGRIALLYWQALIACTILRRCLCAATARNGLPC